MYGHFVVALGGVKYNYAVVKGGGNKILTSNFSFPPAPPSPVINDRSLTAAHIHENGKYILPASSAGVFCVKHKVADFITQKYVNYTESDKIQKYR